MAHPTTRPTAPHLTVYRFTMTMAMSIAHRITGMAMYFGTALIAWWLVAAASGPGPLAVAESFFGSWLGRLVLFGYSWAWFHHMCGGVRYFIWDAAAAHEGQNREFLAWGTLVGGLLLTVLFWTLFVLL